MIWCALDSPDLGQTFKYLGHHHIIHRKFFRATWSWKTPQILFFRANWDSRNFWILVSFWGIFQLQVALKNFLWVIWWCPRYLKGCPRWGLLSARRIMTVRLTNHFLLTKVLTPPPFPRSLDAGSLIPKNAEFVKGWHKSFEELFSRKNIFEPEG